MRHARDVGLTVVKLRHDTSACVHAADNLTMPWPARGQWFRRQEKIRCCRRKHRPVMRRLSERMRLKRSCAYASRRSGEKSQNGLTDGRMDIWTATDTYYAMWRHIRRPSWSTNRETEFDCRFGIYRVRSDRPRGN
jgi:hypothetical protein